MFFSRSNNNGNSVNINTRLYTSYSDTCMVSIGAWNQNLSIKFHPVKGVNADGIRQYAQDNTEIITTSLTPENAEALLTGIKNNLNSVTDTKEPKSVTVAMGSNENKKALTVGFDGENMYVSIAVNLNEEMKTAPENILKHVFHKKENVINYDATTGLGEVVLVEADYNNFIKKIEAVHDIVPTAAHGINYNNAIKQSYNNKQATAQNSNAGYQAPTQTYSGSENMSDFLPFQ